jgi:hypothetical protein
MADKLPAFNMPLWPNHRLGRPRVGSAQLLLELGNG